MVSTIKYKCGCSFPLVNDKIQFSPTMEHLKLDCPIAYDVICNGDTLGVFQLESNLCKNMSKRVAPRNIEEISDLISIVRPGCSESFIDGKNLTNHYIDRKHKKEEVTYLHPSLEPILKSTQGILVYQEQAMTIAKELAGFSLQEADTLRKAIGKKLAEEMAKVKVLFLTKAKEKGIVTDAEAETIFSWIEASQRYSFNKSHGVSYALDAYISAYAKAHFPKEFFCSYLANSRNAANFTDVVKLLVDNARQHSIQVYPPDIRKRNLNFKIYEDGIYCGISNVKKVGASILNSIDELIKQKEKDLNKNIGDLTWTEFLLNISPFIKKDAMESLILSGALSFTKTPRKRMKFEFDKFLDLTDRDISFLLNIKGDTFLERLIILRESPIGRGKPLSNKRRKEAIADIVKQLEEPPYPLEDTALWISETEQQLIGVSLTCSKVDDCDQSSANATCKDFIDGKQGYLMIAVQVNEVKEHDIRSGPKKGEKMAFIKISDSTCSIDNAICFPESWVNVKDVLILGNTIMISGSRDKKNQQTFVVNKAWQI